MRYAQYWASKTAECTISPTHHVFQCVALVKTQPHRCAVFWPPDAAARLRVWAGVGLRSDYSAENAFGCVVRAECQGR